MGRPFLLGSEFLSGDGLISQLLHAVGKHAILVFAQII